MDPLIRIGLRAARRAGRELLATYERPPVSRLGRQALVKYQANLRSKLLRLFQREIWNAYPEHVITQSMAHVQERNPFTWVVLVLDGEANFLRSLNDYCAVIGIFEGAQLQHSIVYEFLQDNEYFATQDIGAMVNQNRLRVARIEALSESVVAVSESNPRDFRLNDPSSEESLTTFIANPTLRTSGCLGLDMARVAQGKLDGLVAMGEIPVSLKLTALLVTEAGGFATNAIDSSSSREDAVFVAANPPLFAKLNQLISPA